MRTMNSRFPDTLSEADAASVPAADSSSPRKLSTPGRGAGMLTAMVWMLGGAASSTIVADWSGRFGWLDNYALSSSGFQLVTYAVGAFGFAGVMFVDVKRRTAARIALAALVGVGCFDLYADATHGRR